MYASNLAFTVPDSLTRKRNTSQQLVGVYLLSSFTLIGITWLLLQACIAKESKTICGWDRKSRWQGFKSCVLAGLLVSFRLPFVSVWMKKKSICFSQSCCQGRWGQWSVPGSHTLARLFHSSCLEIKLTPLRHYYSVREEIAKNQQPYLDKRRRRRCRLS